jgi:hypothetical protein
VELSLIGALVLDGCGKPKPAAPDMGRLDGGACTPQAVRPSGRREIDGVLVPSTHKLLFFGGDTAVPQNPPVRVLANDLWRLDLQGCGWEWFTFADGPGPRSGYAAVFDSKRNRMVLVGGRAGTDPAPPLANDAWALDVSTMKWTQLTPGSTPPAARVGHKAVYDAARDRVFLFGGDTSLKFGEGLLSDAWELSFTASADGVWNQLGASGGPTARREMQIALDSAKNRALLYGGGTSNVANSHEIWSFDLTSDSWTLLPIEGGEPSSRIGGLLVEDAPRQRFVLFSGSDEVIGLTNDTWALHIGDGTPTTWQELAAGDFEVGAGGADQNSPERRWRAGGALDEGKLWTFGGVSDCAPLDDVWSMDLSTQTWAKVYPAQEGETCYRVALAHQSCASVCANPQ